MVKTCRVFLTVMAASGGGCGVAPLEPQALGERSEAATVNNGRSVNGTSVGGTEINGVWLNGTVVNRMTVSGTSIGAWPIYGATLNGTSLSGTYNFLGRAYTVSGKDFIGATLGATVGTGTSEKPISLHVDNIEDNPTATNADVFLYTVSSWDGRRWQPLCAGNDTGDGRPRRAIPVAGRWGQITDSTGKVVDLEHKFSSNTEITFACRDGSSLINSSTIAKCVETLGYKPWINKSVMAGGQWIPASGGGLVNVGGWPVTVSLDNSHQACVRALRADYCGNGLPWTRTGTSIDIYDGANVQTDAYSSTDPVWSFEAAWTPDGAEQISDTRYGTLTFYLLGSRAYIDIRGYINTYCPARNNIPVTPSGAINGATITQLTAGDQTQKALAAASYVATRVQ